MFKISVCMIVKNEERFLKRCLESIAKFVDEIIIVDTGSTDKTIEIAKKFTEKIYSYNWESDFAKARNFSISKASYDWIFVVDADESVIELDRKKVELELNNSKLLVGRIERINPFEDSDGIHIYKERVNRLFNKNQFEYSGKIHEQIVYKADYEREYDLVNIPITLNHDGYMDSVINETNKLDRNLNMLLEVRKTNTKDSYINYQLGKTYYKKKNYEEAYFSFKESLEHTKNLRYEYAEDLVESFGYTMIKLGKYQEGLVLEEFKEIYGNNPDYNFVMGLIFMNNAKFKEAINSFENAKKSIDSKIEGVNSYLANYNIGVIYEVLGYKEEAKSYYEQCGKYRLAVLRLEELKK